MTVKDAALKQPAVFKLAIGTATFERFGFYILTFMLVLFAREAYGFTDIQAFAIFAVVTALAYGLPAIGGYLADNVYGIKRCMLLGLLLEGTGLCLLAIPSYPVFIVALACVAIGVGLFRTTPNNLLGRSYNENDPRIDSGFTLFYMAINVGSAVSSIVSGVVQRYFGWHIAFLAGGVGLIISIILFFIFKYTAKGIDSKPGEAKKIGFKSLLMLPIGLVVAIAVCSFLILHVTIADFFLGLVTVALLGYYIYEIFNSPLKERLRIIACICLITIGMIYFIFYMQLYTSMTLFIERNVARSFMGLKIPTEFYFGLNPFWVIVLGPTLSMIYKWIIKKYNNDLAITTKFTIGLFAVSLGFFLLFLSNFFHNADFQVSSLWIVATIGFYTLGEMLISALGPAMITRILPKRLYGITMGAWFVGVSLATAIAGIFAGIANVPVNVVDPQAVLHIYSIAFLKMGLFGFICTIGVLIASPFIKRMAAH